MVTTPPRCCSFCGRTDKEVDLVIPGPLVSICNVCVEKCNKMMEEKRLREEGGSDEQQGPENG